MRALLPVLTVAFFFAVGCGRRAPDSRQAFGQQPATSNTAAAEPSWIAIPPPGPTDYSIATCVLCVENYSTDKPRLWVFKPDPGHPQRVKYFSGFETKIDIEGIETLSLLVIRRRDGSYTEQVVTNSTVNLTKYISKKRYPISELVADLDKCVK